MDTQNKLLPHNPCKRKFGQNLTNLPQTHPLSPSKSYHLHPPNQHNIPHQPLLSYLHEIEDYTLTQSFLRGIHGSYMEWQE